MPDFCWFVDKVFREFNILKRELCWIWRSESPGKRDRIFAKESCLCSAALTQEDRACCSSPRTLSPKDRLHAWQNRCSRCCRIYLPVSTSNKWEDNKKLFSERPQSKPNDSAVGRGDSKVGIACTRNCTCRNEVSSTYLAQQCCYSVHEKLETNALLEMIFPFKSRLSSGISHLDILWYPLFSIFSQGFLISFEDFLMFSVISSICSHSTLHLIVILVDFRWFSWISPWNPPFIRDVPWFSL